MSRKLNLFVEVDWASVTRCCICEWWLRLGGRPNSGARLALPWMPARCAGASGAVLHPAADACHVWRWPPLLLARSRLFPAGVEPTQTVADVILQALERHGPNNADAISSVVALSSCNKPLPAHEQVGTCGLADMSSIRLRMCMNRTRPTLAETVQLLQDPLLSPKGTGQQWQGLCAGMEAALALLKRHDPLEVLKTRDLHGYTRNQGELEYLRLQSRASVDQLVGTQLATVSTPASACCRCQRRSGCGSR